MADLISPRTLALIRVVVYVISGAGSAVLAYTTVKGWTGDAEVALWAALVAVVNGLAALNVNRDPMNAGIAYSRADIPDLEARYAERHREQEAILAETSATVAKTERAIDELRASVKKGARQGVSEGMRDQRERSEGRRRRVR